ncbi:MAG: hypothetical protein ABFD20_03065, partial [Anaerolineales bacterium]
DVSLRVERRAELVVPESIALGPHPQGGFEGRLTLKNTGLAPAHVVLQPLTPDIALARDEADIKPEGSVRMRVTSAQEPAEGAALLLTSGGARWTIRVERVQ